LFTCFAFTSGPEDKKEKQLAEMSHNLYNVSPTVLLESRC